MLRPVLPLGPYLEAKWDGTRLVALQALFSIYAHYRTGQPEPVIVKFPSLNILDLPIVREVWSDVPCLGIIRDPVEVMVANLHGPGFMTLQQTPERTGRLLGWTDSSESIASMRRSDFVAQRGAMQPYFDLRAL